MKEHKFWKNKNNLLSVQGKMKRGGYSQRDVQISALEMNALLGGSKFRAWSRYIIIISML